MEIKKTYIVRVKDPSLVILLNKVYLLEDGSYVKENETGILVAITKAKFEELLENKF